MLLLHITLFLCSQRDMDPLHCLEMLSVTISNLKPYDQAVLEVTKCEEYFILVTPKPAYCS